MSDQVKVRSGSYFIDIHRLKLLKELFHLLTTLIGTPVHLLVYSVFKIANVVEI